MVAVQDGWWAMMISREDLSCGCWWDSDVTGQFLGRWETRDGVAALVAFEGRDVIGLLFGLKQGPQFRPVEARYMPASVFPSDGRLIVDLVERWRSEMPYEVATLATTAIRELPMGQMVAQLIERSSESPGVDIPTLLSEEVEHSAVNNAQESDFRSARELRSRIQQLKAAYHYVGAVTNGEVAPLDAVARQLDLKGASPRARAGTLIQYARKNGYLSDSMGTGRAGGELTALAVEHATRIAALGGRHV